MGDTVKPLVAMRVAEIDDQLSDTSENPVKNKAVAEKFKKLFVVGEIEPEEGPVFWFNTSGLSNLGAETMLLNLGEDDEAVSAEIEGEVYGVDNMTIDEEPDSPGVYDFTIK